MEDYERLVEAAIAQVLKARGPRLVVQGPAGFNEGGTGVTPHSDPARIYDRVNDMVRRVAERHSVPVVDRIAVVKAGGDSLYLPGATGRYSSAGHRMMGRALGEVLLRSGVV